MPLSKDWQSGGMKWGMWKTPLFTFSRSWRKLSWSKGRAPCRRHKKMVKKNRCGKMNLTMRLSISKHHRGDHAAQCKQDIPPTERRGWRRSSTRLLSAHRISHPAKHNLLKVHNSTTVFFFFFKKRTKYHWEHGNTVTAHKWNNSICDGFACSFVTICFAPN